jgi:hypothetical protein
MEWLGYSIGFVLLIASGIWVLGATRAGLLIRDRTKTASTPDDSMEAFSRGKKFVNVGPWKIAYIDQGGGTPCASSKRFAFAK